MEVICGALLHDTVEDTATTPEELETEFGKTIRDIVMDETDDKSLSKVDRKRLQIEHAAHIREKAKLAKLADKISNLRDLSNNPPHDWTLEQRPQSSDWAKKELLINYQECSKAWKSFLIRNIQRV